MRVMSFLFKQEGVGKFGILYDGERERSLPSTHPSCYEEKKDRRGEQVNSLILALALFFLSRLEDRTELDSFLSYTCPPCLSFLDPRPTPTYMFTSNSL